MLTHKQFSEIGAGEFVLFKSGKLRQVIKTSHFSGPRVEIKPRCYLYFNKVKGKGTTIMMYGDLNRKALGVWKLKTMNHEK